MKRSEWSDRELEELLRRMPKIRDHRDPRDIYRNISIRKHIPALWFIPGIAAVSALLLFLIFIPRLMTGTSLSEKHVSRSKTTNSEAVKSDVNDHSPRAERNKENSSSPKIALLDAAKVPEPYSGRNKTAVYENDVRDGKVLIYWIPDQQGQILVPVSTVVRKTQGKSWLTLFNEKMASLREREWGLSHFYPLRANLKLDASNQNVNVDVTDSLYTQGSNNETNFIHVLEKDISSNSNIKKIKLTTNGNPGVNFGNYGEIGELNLKRDKCHGFFFYYPKLSNLPFLVPSVASYKDIKGAIAAMKHDQVALGLKGSLSNIQLSQVAINGKTLMIAFNGSAGLHNDQMTLLSFEAILLTAKEFGLDKVIIKGASGMHIGPFDLSKEIKVPIAPNFRNF
ncbi:hypothetical protein HPT25_25125 [Bacillus sp. BRMEA1]|uniref:hypothetical protein n=1 Tax=Neobacillus endophyticus TaxID=2738405 RepID=UPI0015664ACA|nr:hypothetical protein [Neobacillus endophyticus]NRD80611.1 hypothetical protein [Neobacillus endophyticus]